MREKDFEMMAQMRIERAKKEEDCKTLSMFIVENYPASVREVACRALGELSSEESVSELFDALFCHPLNVETEAMIISTLSTLISPEDLEECTASYDISSDNRTMKLYTVLNHCLKR